MTEPRDLQSLGHEFFAIRDITQHSVPPAVLEAHRAKRLGPALADRLGLTSSVPKHDSDALLLQQRGQTLLLENKPIALMIAKRLDMRTQGRMAQCCKVIVWNASLPPGCLTHQCPFKRRSTRLSRSPGPSSSTAVWRRAVRDSVSTVWSLRC
jgi:hypothetical protein